MFEKGAWLVLFSIHKKVTLYNVVILLLLYINIILVFGVIYSILDATKLGPIIEHQEAQFPHPTFDQPLFRSLYFSAITMLSVGYGDVTPYGWSRVVAMIESIIGGILPAAIVIRFMLPIRSTTGLHRMNSSER